MAILSLTNIANNSDLESSVVNSIFAEIENFYGGVTANADIKVTGLVQGLSITDGVATMTLGALSSITNIGMSGAITLGVNTISDATLTGDWAFSTGNLSGIGTIGSRAITSTGAIQGLSLTDGVATLSSGSLTSIVNIGMSGTLSFRTNTLSDGVVTGNWSFAAGNLSSIGTIGSGAITSTGAIQGLSITDGTATLSAGDLSGVGTVTATSIAGTITTAAQANITSLGTLTSLSVSGNLTVDTSLFHVNSTAKTVSIGKTSTTYEFDVYKSGQDTYLNIHSDVGYDPTLRFQSGLVVGGAIGYDENFSYMKIMNGSDDVSGSNNNFVMSSTGKVCLNGTEFAAGRHTVVQSTDANTEGMAVYNNALGASFRFWVDGSGIRHITSGTTDIINMNGSAMTVGSPTGGFQSAGTINAKGVYDDGVLLTDYVFEKHYLDYAKEEKHSKYKMKTIGEEIAFTKNNLHLSTIVGRKEWEADAEKGKKQSLGKLVSQIWETVETLFLYIAEIHNRVSKLCMIVGVITKRLDCIEERLK